MNHSFEILRYAEGSTPMGKILVVVNGHGVCALRLREGNKRFTALQEIHRAYPGARLVHDARGLRPILEQIHAALTGQGSAARIKLALAGTPFQQRVWQQMRRVPRGRTCSYQELARRVGRPRAVRAVANACAKNPVALLVPCHRIVRADGGLGGYFYGLEKKRQILLFEQRRGSQLND